MRFAAAGLAAVAVALGAYALGNSNSNNGSSGTANAAPVGQFTPGAGGQPPSSGFGTPVTGATATKAAAAALSRYKGNIEGVMKLSDGSYVAHVITSNGEYHVTVSKDFKVTGAQQGGPPGAGGTGAAPPSGE
jgi:hypothetical protein